MSHNLLGTLENGAGQKNVYQTFIGSIPRNPAKTSKHPPLSPAPALAPGIPLTTKSHKPLACSSLSAERQGFFLRFAPKALRGYEPPGSHPPLSYEKKLQVVDLQLLICGKTGIRTLGTRKGTTVFETVPIDHSGIFPFGGAKVAPFFGVCKFLAAFLSPGLKLCR